MKNILIYTQGYPAGTKLKVNFEYDFTNCKLPELPVDIKTIAMDEYESLEGWLSKMFAKSQVSTNLK